MLLGLENFDGVIDKALEAEINQSIGLFTIELSGLSRAECLPIAFTKAAISLEAKLAVRLVSVSGFILEIKRYQIRSVIKSAESFLATRKSLKELASNEPCVPKTFIEPVKCCLG